MIVTIKDEYSGMVIAYSEFQQVDYSGKSNSLGGIIRIDDIWIHENFRFSNVFARLIEKIYVNPFLKDCDTVYWCISRDEEGRKISDDSIYSTPYRRTSRLWNKHYIFNKIIGVKQCLEKSLA